MILLDELVCNTRDDDDVDVDVVVWTAVLVWTVPNRTFKELIDTRVER
jgi:hypothetical protein